MHILLKIFFILNIFDLIAALPAFPTSNQTVPISVPALVPAPLPPLPPPITPGQIPSQAPVPFVVFVNSPHPLFPSTLAPELRPSLLETSSLGVDNVKSEVYKHLLFVFIETFGDSNTLGIAEIKFYGQNDLELPRPLAYSTWPRAGALTDGNILTPFIVSDWKPGVEVIFEFPFPVVVVYYEVWTTSQVTPRSYPSAWNVFRHDGTRWVPLSPAIGVSSQLRGETRLNPPSGRFYTVMQPRTPKAPVDATAERTAGFDSETLAIVVVSLVAIVGLAIFIAVVVRIRGEYMVPDVGHEDLGSHVCIDPVTGTAVGDQESDVGRMPVKSLPTASASPLSQHRSRIVIGEREGNTPTMLDTGGEEIGSMRGPRGGVGKDQVLWMTPDPVDADDEII